ncbi:hypothetical protein SAMN06273572_102207 [Monaibacterium marinum]|uniref:Uncharacterized protein n=1 Tax=Pontivivens marinum TaxID=1690039 RepID=A0A2C9CQN7_9RHOB|nr:hypothetical protein [Monaibacterium marinum]SOH93530.1 hypothetical protein SAMN06273572_102207 [Monaibacterium marinum]
MFERRLITMSGLAIMATLTLAACNREEVEAEPEVVVEPDMRVAQIDRLDIGRSPGGWIVTAHARDERGVIERMHFSEGERTDDVLSYDLESAITEIPAQGLGRLMPQAGLAAEFIPDAELDGVMVIEVNALNGSQRITVPQRVQAPVEVEAQ